MRSCHLLGGKMNSVQLRWLPDILSATLSLFLASPHDSALINGRKNWRELDSINLKNIFKITGAATAHRVPGVAEMFEAIEPDVVLSYRWEASMGEIYDALLTTCTPTTRLWIDILFNNQNSQRTSMDVLELTPRRYQDAPRHLLFVSSTQDLLVLILRGWIMYELASRMKSDKPMVELLDPSRKVVELYLQGSAGVIDFFAEMQTTFAEDAELIRDAIRQLFAHGPSEAAAATPELNFNRRVSDMLYFAGGKLHIDALMEAGEFEDAFQHCLDVGEELTAVGKYQDVLAVRRQQVVAARELGEEAVMEMATSLSHLGQMQRVLGMPEEGLVTLEEALELCIKHGGRESRDAGETLREIGTALDQMRRYEESLKKKEEALRILAASSGDESEEVAHALNSIAVTLKNMGQADEALAKYDASLRISEGCFGEEHEMVALTLNNIGFACLEMRRYAEARERFRRAHALIAALVGDTHDLFHRTLIGEAICLKQLGEARAPAMFEEGARKLRVALGDAGARHMLAEVSRLWEAASPGGGGGGEED